MSLRTLGRDERGVGRGCGAEREEGLQDEIERREMRGGRTDTDGCGKGSERGMQTGEEFEKDERRRHKRERED